MPSFPLRTEVFLPQQSHFFVGPRRFKDPPASRDAVSVCVFSPLLPVQEAEAIQEFGSFPSFMGDLCLSSFPLTRQRGLGNPENEVKLVGFLSFSLWSTRRSSPPRQIGWVGAISSHLT